MIRRGAVFVALALFAALLVPSAQRAKADTCLLPLRLWCADDTSWRDNLETRIADNMRDGQVYEVDYATTARILGQVTHVGAFGDSALWTGTYLASQAMRYAVAKKHLANPLLPPLDGTDWAAQKAQAQARILDMVRKFHILINISRYWEHQLDPKLKPFGFGGGIIHGEPGYLMRACVKQGTPASENWSADQLKQPTDEGLPPPYTNDRRIFGPFPWQDKPTDPVTNYFCEDGTSRDAYAGTIFGLLVAFDLFGHDNLTVQRAIRDDIVTMSNFAFKWLWNTPRPHGRVSIPIDSNHDGPTCSPINQIIDICGHDFENFFSPLFLLTPTAQMEMTQAAQHVTHDSPGHPDTAKWAAIFDAELVAMTPFMGFGELLDATDPYGSYYKWNLEHLIGYNLVREAPNVVAKLIYKQALGVMDASTGNDVNAHFEAINYGITGDSGRLRDAITHLRQWRDYRTRINANTVTDNTPICATAGACVPDDQVDVTVRPMLPVVTVPGTSTSLRAHNPLPVANRTPTDFLWQRPPNQLTGTEGATHQAPGIDYLLPYWMIRYLTEVNIPAYDPYPPYLGPSFN